MYPFSKCISGRGKTSEEIFVMGVRGSKGLEWTSKICTGTKGEILGMYNYVANDLVSQIINSIQALLNTSTHTHSEKNELDNEPSPVNFIDSKLVCIQ